MRPGILRYEDKEVHGRLVRVAICAPGEGEAPPKDNFNRKPPSWYGAPPDGQGKTSWGCSLKKNILDGAKWRRDSR